VEDSTSSCSPRGMKSNYGFFAIRSSSLSGELYSQFSGKFGKTDSVVYSFWLIVWVRATISCGLFFYILTRNSPFKFLMNHKYKKIKNSHVSEYLVQYRMGCA
jgi:hypothetical protein